MREVSTVGEESPRTDDRQDTTAVPEQHGESIASVDLGSNSFHMVVARVSEGAPTRLDRHKETVRLGAGLDERQRLTKESQGRALECLERFGQRLREIAPSNVRAVGTNTLRRARNAAFFLRRAEDALGHPIEVISGIEEARLIYLGVARSLSAEGQRRLVIDVGGGSTELIVGERSQPLALESLYMGCVSMTRRHFANGVITPEAWSRALLTARLELEPVASRFRKLGWRHAVGSSGTIRAVGRVLREAGWSETAITPKGLKRLRRRLLEIGAIDAIDLTGVSSTRQPVFVGGAVIVTAVMKALRIERLEVADGALREGVLYDMLGRWRHEDTRARSVASFVERYHVDEKQSRRVEATAVQLLHQVAESWKLSGPEPERALRWAAQLHEIGLDIAHGHYHKHGAYIIANSDLPGFSLRDQDLIATLVRAHRRKLPVDDIRSKPTAWLRLAVLLRLATLLHRSRSSRPLPPLRLEARKKQVVLRIPEEWFDKHPLTRADLEQEACDLEAVGVELRVE